MTPRHAPIDNASKMADDEAWVEIFFDSDSEDEFVGFTEEENAENRLRREQRMAERGDGGDQGDISDVTDDSSGEADDRVPDAYDHDWLNDFRDFSGPTHVPDAISEVELFRLIVSDDILELFVNETNRYAQQMKDKTGDAAKPNSRVAKWWPMTLPEMKAFVAILP